MRRLRLAEFFNFRLCGRDLGFQFADFVRIIELLLGPGQARLQLADLLPQQVDAFLGFFVHGALSISIRHCRAVGFRGVANSDAETSRLRCIADRHSIGAESAGIAVAGAGPSASRVCG